MSEELPPPKGMEELGLPDIDMPWKEDLVFYSMKYNCPVKEIKESIGLLKKIVSSRNFDDALAVFRMIVSNLSSSPHYLSLVPIDSKIVNMVVLDYNVLAKKAREFGVNIRANAETNIVLIYYVMPGSREIEVLGWKLHWYPVTREGKFFTEPLCKKELENLLPHIPRLKEIESEIEKEARKEKRKELKKSFKKLGGELGEEEELVEELEELSEEELMAMARAQ